MVQESLAGLVGRAAELDAFEAALTDLDAGRGGSILVEGEPGIGKSAVVEAGAAAARTRGFKVVYAACDELETRYPLAVMSRALKTDATVAAAAGPSAASEAGGPGRGVPVLAEDPVVVEAERLLEVVDRWCAAAPLVLMLDDLQWADDASLKLWRRLSRAASQLPLMAVGAARLVPVREELQGLRRDLRRGGNRILALQPLATAEMTALAQRHTGGSPGPRLAERLSAAGGNPLYARELLDALERADALTVTGGVAEIIETKGAEGLTGAGAETWTRVISDRLAFLSSDCLAAVRTAAVLGPDFSAAELGAAADRAPMAVVGLLEEAITAGVLESAGVRLRFRHGLIRQALFEGMPRALRDLLQQNAARSLMTAQAPVERVAQMLLVLDGAVQGWELDWLVEHARTLLCRAPEVAADLFERALEHARGNDARVEALRDHLAMVAMFLHRTELAERLAREILAGSVDGNRRGQAVWNLALVLARSQRFDEASALVDEALTDSSTTQAWQARLSSLRAQIYILAGRFSEALETADRAAMLGEEQSDTMALGHALFSAGYVHSRLGDQARAIRLCEHALTVIGTNDPRTTPLRQALLGNLATLVAAEDRFGDAARLLAEARNLAERFSTHAAAIVQMHTASVAFELGRWDEAAAGFESLLEQEFTAKGPTEAVLLHGISAMIALHRDDVDALAAHLGAVDDKTLADPLGLLNSTCYVLAKALAAYRAGEVDAAVEALRAIHDAERGQVENRESVFPVLIQLALRAGNRELALEVSTTCARDAEDSPSARSEAFAHWCRGLIQTDTAPISEAAAYFRATDRLLELGNAMEDLAALAAAAGRPEEARTALAEAMSVYTRLGAVWDARHAVARLREAGLKVGVRGPRRRPSTGWDALTETERRVAELVAQGDSNTEIAERMVLSRRTVEVHVSHVLGKLQVRSRREVAAFKTR